LLYFRYKKLDLYYHKKVKKSIFPRGIRLLKIVRYTQRKGAEFVYTDG